MDSMTTETWTDLWEQNATQNGQKVYAWTIEHIFPEGDNIPQEWVNMIAGGDVELARKYRMELPNETTLPNETSE